MKNIVLINNIYELINFDYNFIDEPEQSIAK
jgi:hypothetical protein